MRKLKDRWSQIRAHWPTLATILAILLFFILLVAGAVLIAKDSPSFDRPETTATFRVFKGPGSRRRVTKIEWQRESAPGGGGAQASRPQRKKTVRRKAESPEGRLARSKTISERHPRSFLESLSGEAGLFALQGAVVFVAAFIAAALLQRVLVGNFRFRIGSLDLSDAAAAANAGINATRYDKELTTALEEMSKRMGVIETSLGKVAPTTAHEDLPAELGSFEIDIPDARKHVEEQSERYAWLAARAGNPFLGLKAIEAKILEPDVTSEPTDEPDDPTGTTQDD